jgi:hypothetical protein
MIAGTVLALGPSAISPAGQQARLDHRRRPRGRAATYRLACTWPHVRLLLTSLRRRFAFPADASLLAGPYDRYCGDAGEVGKGEILVWTGHARAAIV